MLALIMDDRQDIEEALVSGILAQDKGYDACYFVHDYFKVATTYLSSNENDLNKIVFVCRKKIATTAFSS